MTFINDETIAFAYSLTEHAIFSLKTKAPVDITLPTATTTTGMSAFSGLTGYMTLGLGAKSKPSLLTTKESEVLIAKDSEFGRNQSDCVADVLEDVGHFFNADGSPSRPERIDWPAPPEETGKDCSMLRFRAPNNRPSSVHRPICFRRSSPWDSSFRTN
jgi:hypothetical protein